MKVKILTVFCILFLLVLAKGNLYSQESNNHIFEINFLSIPYEDINDFMTFYETVGKPLDADNEYILSVKVFRHAFGPLWSVCMITEYKDMEGFVAAEKRGDEIFMKKYPDKSKRDEIMKKYQVYLKGHSDALVRDYPNLEKK